SLRTGWMRTSTSATTRWAAARSWRWSWRALPRGAGPPPPSAPADRSRPLRRTERDEEGQVLGDVVELVRDRRRDEHDRAGTNVADAVADGVLAATGHDVIDLVLGVRLLEVRLADREDVQPDAQVRNRDELEVRLAAGLSLVPAVRAHRASQRGR